MTIAPKLDFKPSYTPRTNIVKGGSRNWSGGRPLGREVGGGHRFTFLGPPPFPPRWWLQVGYLVVCLSQNTAVLIHDQVRSSLFSNTGNPVLHVFPPQSLFPAATTLPKRTSTSTLHRTNEAGYAQHCAHVDVDRTFPFPRSAPTSTSNAALCTTCLLSTVRAQGRTGVSRAAARNRSVAER